MSGTVIRRCGRCGKPHDSMADAMDCCAEEFDDDDPGAAPALVADGGVITAGIQYVCRVCEHRDTVYVRAVNDDGRPRPPRVSEHRLLRHPCPRCNQHRTFVILEACSERTIDRLLSEGDTEVTADGGVDRPAFIDPQTEWVECYLCGAELVVGDVPIDGIDVSDDDEYYPDMRPVCGGEEHIGNPMADGGITGRAPRLVDDPTDWPTTREVAVERLVEDDPDALFLVTGRATDDGDGAWTGDTVGIRSDLSPDVRDAVVEDMVEHVLVTLLLETDESASDLAERLGEIEARIAASRGGEA